jgi:flagellar biosynthesis protein FliQ
MGVDQATGLLSQLFWQAFLISLPMLAVTLAVGLLVSVVQVVTQLQEMSLSYVPKLFAALVVLLVLGPWMLGRITSYASSLLGSLSTLG